MAMFKKGQLVEVSSRNGDWDWEGIGMIVKKPIHLAQHPQGTQYDFELLTGDGIVEVTWSTEDANNWGWYVEVIS